MADDVSDCLYNIGEEVLQAKQYADAWRAQDYKSSSEPYHTAEKEEARLCNESLSIAARSEAGTRAMRKFWEAKVAARRLAAKRK